MARRRKRTTAISSDSESDSKPSEPKSTPKPSKPKANPKDIHSLMHSDSYIQIVKWSFNAQQKMFTLIKVNGGIKVLDIMQLMLLAPPFMFDLEKLPLDNPDNGSDGRIAIKWVKVELSTRLYRDKQPSEGRSYSSEEALLSKGNLLLLKAVQDKLLRKANT
ncbi:hypothetical protein E3N88_28372 [Mikania micrantha]|uniref:Uncharacterized protein n=1 Tax=Mikania micrantha TaxID=192012 RepID=A0A5N6MZV3_9ASTR|nr:hypothetical protein E3N88_28372 [Mikania micrantha]